MFYETPEEQARLVFSANRPGWVDQVQPGDILIGGKQFRHGLEPAGGAFAEERLASAAWSRIRSTDCSSATASISAFPGLECPGIDQAFEEGDVAEVDFEAAIVRNVTRGVTLNGRATPPKLLDLLKAGGIYPLLEKEGLIAPKV